MAQSSTSKPARRSSPNPVSLLPTIDVPGCQYRQGMGRYKCGCGHPSINRVVTLEECRVCPLIDDGQQSTVDSQWPIADNRRPTVDHRQHCLHLGHELRREPCSCPRYSDGVPVRSCALHGECVTTSDQRERVRSGSVKIHTCETCRDWADREPLASLPTDRVDVVIPYCQNNLPWLRQSVESILNQIGVTPIVHLIADGFDLPDDPSRAFSENPQCRLYRNHETIGPYRTLHRIFDRLETPWIAVQDSDDIALPHRLRHSLDALTRGKGGEVFGAAMRQFLDYTFPSDELRDQLGRLPILHSGHKKWRMCPDGNLINGTLVMRRETFERLNGFMPLMGSADLEFATRCHRSGVSVVTSGEIVGLRRLHARSLSHGPRHGVGTRTRDAAHQRIKTAYGHMVNGFDPREFGGLDQDQRDARQTVRVNGGKIDLRNLEIHVTHACNLRCQQCAHYSDHGHKGMLTPDEADRQMGLWSGRLRPKLFSLLGGEPTLNPDLTEIVRIAGRHWPESQLQLVTNGFLLGRHPDLPSSLKSTGCRLEISVHHAGDEYQRRLRPVRELVDQWQWDHGIMVNWRESSTRWQRQYRVVDGRMLPYEDGDPQRSWAACSSKWCPQIHDGHLWKCPPIAYLRMQGQRHGLPQDWSAYLSYNGLDADCTDDELAAFVSRRAESICAMCPASPERFDLPSPLIQLER